MKNLILKPYPSYINSFYSLSIIEGDFVTQTGLVRIIVSLSKICSIFFFRGGNDDSDEYLVFRKWFRHVGELRSLFPSAPVLALSATCTNKIKNVS